MCVQCLLYTYSVYNVPTVNQRKYFTCQESSNFKGISGTKILCALEKVICKKRHLASSIKKLLIL